MASGRAHYSTSCGAIENPLSPRTRRSTKESQEYGLVVLCGPVSLGGEHLAKTELGTRILGCSSFLSRYPGRTLSWRSGLWGSLEPRLSRKSRGGLTFSLGG